MVFFGREYVNHLFLFFSSAGGSATPVKTSFDRLWPNDP